MKVDYCCELVWRSCMYVSESISLVAKPDFGAIGVHQ